ncbi:hypothetical protein AZE42_06352 [Rhizopogon vesiculosus]|uniref:Uncharacterized protein n=1 Tax=Rhizopogon vesiculosus TaxID=180088 RepID=A0A1J8Q688_9AGAM|nr:hypothetical protein AZE42_06352 [Rhizopogon vesiculosus]
MPAFSTPLAKHQTPLCRVVTAIFRSPLQASRRPRPRSNSLDSARPTISHPILYTPLPAVALQTPSLSTDSIIITSLRRAPFCCHEDLVTMARPELVRVAQSINGRLPKALQIACGDDLHDADIRRAIEVLVGIRAETGRCSAPVLGSPRVAQTKSMSATLADETALDMDVDSSATDDDMGVIPSSPLSMRRRRLGILKEEQEHEEPSERRMSTSVENVQTPAGPVSAASGSRLIENIDMSASRLLSSDSTEDVYPVTNSKGKHCQPSTHLSSRSPEPREVVICLPFASSPKAQPTRILRSHSQSASINSVSAQTSSLKRAQSDANVTLKRTRYHFKRGRGTLKVVNRVNVPEVEKYRALPPISTGSALVDFLTPKPRGESVSTTVSQEKSEIGAGAAKAINEIVV